MGHNSFRRRESGARRCNNRVLRLEPLEPRIALAAAAPHFLGLVDAALAAYVKGLSADGSINRADMINILRKAEQEPGGFVHASELMDLRKIVQDAPVLKMPDYVAVLARRRRQPQQGERPLSRQAVGQSGGRRSLHETQKAHGQVVLRRRPAFDHIRLHKDVGHAVTVRPGRRTATKSREI